MDELRPLDKTGIPAMAAIMTNAYPGGARGSDWNEYTERRVKQVREQQCKPGTSGAYYGLYRDGQLLGGARLYTYSMRYRSSLLRASGIGSVAVDFYHKKEHLAKSMLSLYLQKLRDERIPLALLYAFRTDFYQQMGYGLAGQRFQFQLPPTRFPAGSKDQVRPLTKHDAPALHRLYQRQFNKTHGLIDKDLSEVESWFEGENQLAGVVDGGEVRGCFRFRFQAEHDDNFIRNNMQVTDLMYETPQALRQLLAFLHSQKDQIQHVLLTTADRDFYQLIADARNATGNMLHGIHQETNQAATGLMYRVLDVPLFFEQLQGCRFGRESLVLGLDIADSFLPANAGQTVIRFDQGLPRLEKEAKPDFKLSLDISHFSSLVMGAVGLEKLVQYGLASVERTGQEKGKAVDAGSLARLANLLRAPQPQCLTYF